MKILIQCPIDKTSIKELVEHLRIPEPYDTGFYTSAANADMETHFFKDRNFTAIYLQDALNAHYNFKEKDNVIFIGLCSYREKFDVVITYNADALIAHEIALAFDENEMPLYQAKDSLYGFTNYEHLNNYLQELYDTE